MSHSRSACFVTPSYSGDFERCRLLVESREVCAPGINHYLLVDKPDIAQFQALSGPHTIVVDSRELIDRELHKLPGANGWWLGRRVLPLRGWITQQLRKLAMPRITDSDVLINLDSDVVFIRPFATDMLFIKDRLGLFEVDFRNEAVHQWSRQSARLTGVEAPLQPNNHVGMMIGWWRAVACEVTDRIERQSGLPWQIALGRCRSFSEYMLYGTYVRGGPGHAACGHIPDSRMLVQTSWHKDTGSAEGLADLFRSAPGDAVAVMVHSKDRLSPESYASYARALWAGRDVEQANGAQW